ncbi:MAG: FAD-dependent tricarballylate dehydrogenase TcuA [Burkholderiales bacterium]
MLYLDRDLPQEQHDVLVLGSGLAGMSAAFSAREAGARVTLIDKAPETSRSGNTRFSGGALRCPTADNTVEMLVEELARVTSGRADTGLSRTLYRTAAADVEWLRALGAPIASPSVERPDLRGGRMSYHVQGNGYGLVEAIYPKLSERGIAVKFETKATDILIDCGGRVAGVRARSREGYVDMLANSVVLATGGFQANTAMRVQYLGKEAGSLVVRGSRHNTGDGLTMALAIGAQSTGDWGGFHSAVLDARSPPVEAGETNVNSYPYTVMVNALGERFVDEGEDFFDTTYVKYGKAILSQPGRIAYCLFDAKLAEQDLVYCLHREFEPIEAGSIERLAEQLRIPPARLVDTIDRFNAAVQPGTFDSESLDGKCTRGVTPEKSNWATTLDTPPYFAYPVTGGITFTLGGLQVDQRARVLDTEARAIPRLFAAGEILGGLFYDNYPGGASLIRSLVFGRIAGREAASASAAAAAA